MLLLVNLLWMGWELEFHGSLIAYNLGINNESPVSWETFRGMDEMFRYGDIIFTVVLAIDVIVRVALLGFAFWKRCMNYIDVAVVITSVFGVFLYSGVLYVPVNPMLFRLLRFARLARTFRMSSALQPSQQLTKCLSANVNVLFRTFCLLTCLLCIAGLVVCTLCRDFMTDDSIRLEPREVTFRYYGTFSRTILTMFEILFTEEAEPVRVLVENIGEWFSVFFPLRYVLRFTVFEVVTAVVIEQTIQRGKNDAELALKQKERDTAMYTRKVKKVFATMDKSGD